jgi:hypothetical protein
MRTNIRNNIRFEKLLVSTFETNGEHENCNVFR